MSRYLMTALMHHRPPLGRRLAFARARLSARLRCHLSPLPECGAPPATTAPVQAMGLTFPNPLGIAAGFDKTGALGRAAGALGFGCIEVGTLTPEALPLCLPSEQSQGVIGTILGVNVGMSRHTPPWRALQDYLVGLRAVWDQADYVAINLCSPQAAALLSPSHEATLEALLVALKQEQRALIVLSGRYVPLAVKIKLALGGVALPKVMNQLVALGFDALIAAIDAGPPATPQRYADWQAPESQRQACYQIDRLATVLSGHLPIITVGGISAAWHADERLRAGATLVQLHNALVYEGPRVALSMQGADMTSP